jgi:ferredoxin-NADP reductase
VPNTHFIVCGPSGFMKASQKLLKEAGATGIHQEVFGTG